MAQNLHSVFLPALLAGTASGLLYLLIYIVGLGFVFMFLPTLPIFAVGLTRGGRVANQAMLVACCIILLLISPASALIYLLLFGAPASYMARWALAAHVPPSGGAPLWFPIGMILTYLTLYALCFIGINVFWYAGEAGGLPTMVSQHINLSIQSIEQEYGSAMGEAAREISFLVFPVTIWLWGICLYAHGWFTNRQLARAGKAIRPDFAITPFSLPGWMLYLLAVSALASLIGSESMRFFGKTALIALMMPYFFQGMALMHLQSVQWPNRRFFLFFIYFVLLSQLWPALLVACLGLWEQLKTLNKRLPGSGSSSNN